MTEGYIPLTAEIRTGYALDEFGKVSQYWGNVFNRWLAAHDAEIRADQIEKDAKTVLALRTESTGVMRRAVVEPSAAARAIRAQLQEEE